MIGSSVSFFAGISATKACIKVSNDEKRTHCLLRGIRPDCSFPQQRESRTKVSRRAERARPIILHVSQRQREPLRVSTNRVLRTEFSLVQFENILDTE